MAMYFVNKMRLIQQQNRGLQMTFCVPLERRNTAEVVRFNDNFALEMSFKQGMHFL